MSLDDEGAKNLLNSVMDIWILPEIAKRKKDKILDDTFILNRAQVILNPKTNSTEVRLNSEVNALLIGVAKRGIKVNEVAPLEDMINEIKEIRLTDRDDPDVGHLTMLQFQGKWIIHFDFRYFKTKLQEFFESAREFLEISKISFEKKKMRAFVDTLFSCVELLATCQIYNMAGKDFEKKRKHRNIQVKYNSFVKIGNFRPEYKDTLNKLSGLRDNARYLKDKFSLDDKLAEEFLKIVEDMLNYTQKRIS
ncbi:MAG: HEPN domain-containing protein [Nitrosotalea sp.]